MTVNTIIRLMEQLKQLHESLLTLSQKKTELLKSNDMNEIQQLLTQERKHIQAIGQVEKKRAASVEEWYRQQGISEIDPTVTEMLSHLDGNEHRELTSAYEDLIFVLADLKKQEQLNAELTKQSLQFVNMSLDLLQPSLDSVNYGGKDQETSKPKRSVFDSKA